MTVSPSYHRGVHDHQLICNLQLITFEPRLSISTPPNDTGQSIWLCNRILTSNANSHFRDNLLVLPLTTHFLHLSAYLRASTCFRACVLKHLPAAPDWKRTLIAFRRSTSFRVEIVRSIVYPCKIKAHTGHGSTGQCKRLDRRGPDKRSLAETNFCWEWWTKNKNLLGKLYEPDRLYTSAAMFISVN